VAHPALGKMGGKGEASTGVSFYRGRRERGDDCGPTRRHQDVGMHRVPMSRVTDWWPSVRSSNLA
jgi:hypothetical protein